MSEKVKLWEVEFGYNFMRMTVRAEDWKEAGEKATKKFEKEEGIPAKSPEGYGITRIELEAEES